MAAKIISNEIYPDSTISLALFREVDNTKEIRQCVMDGKFVAAILKSSMIVDPFQVVVAANKAVHQSKVSKTMTKNVHTEILYNLSPTKNISESFRKFGAGDNDNSVFIAIIDDVDHKTFNIVKETVNGKLVDVNEVSKLTDFDAVKKIYKLTDEELKRSSLDSIVTRIAAKDIMTV